MNRYEQLLMKFEDDTRREEVDRTWRDVYTAPAVEPYWVPAQRVDSDRNPGSSSQ